MTKQKKAISLILKTIVFVASFVSVVLCFTTSPSFMGGITSLLYFTIQSNLWIGFTCLIGAIFIIIESRTKKQPVRKWMMIVKFMFTVAITLTGVVFCFVLAPTLGKRACTSINILSHVVVPILAVADFFVYDANFKWEYRHSLYACITPLYYLIFASIGYVRNWQFYEGNNYPYFFMNWGSEAGAFGFSKSLPFVGVFYWILLMLAFVVGVALLYIFIAKKIRSKKETML